MEVLKMVKQLSVFLENTKGRLAEMTEVLREAELDLLALSIADTTSFGIARAIVSDNERAVKVLQEAGFTVHLNDVLAVVVPDHPGGLSEILKIMLEHDISVEYLYSFVRNPGTNAIILFKLDNPAIAGQLMKDSGVELLSKADLSKM